MRNKERKEINEEEFFGFARSYLSEAFPNPQRVDCPPDSDPMSMAEHPSEGGARTRQPASHLLFPVPQPLRGNSGRPKEASESRIASHRDLNFWIADDSFRMQN